MTFLRDAGASFKDEGLLLGDADGRQRTARAISDIEAEPVGLAPARHDDIATGAIRDGDGSRDGLVGEVVRLRENKAGGKLS
jgi:hypothetical protein